MTEAVLTRPMDGSSIIAIGEDHTQIVFENGLGIAAINTYGLESDESVSEFCRFLGFDYSPRPNEYLSNGDIALAWVRPGKWLLTGIESRVMEIAEHASDFSGAIVLSTPFSKGRKSLCLSGVSAKDVLLSLIQFDLQSVDHGARLAISTRFGELRVFIQALEDRDSWRIIVDQSDCYYATRLLVESLKNVGGRMR